MKKLLILILSILILTTFCACNKKNTTDDTQSGITIQTDTSNLINSKKEDIEVDNSNRAIIATALNIDPNSRNIRFILSTLNTIDAGTIQKAEFLEENSQQILNIISEEGTPFSIYLTKNGSVDAVKNTKTGEWVIQSSR